MLENVQTNYLQVHIACWKPMSFLKQNTAQHTLPYNQMRLIYIYIYIYKILIVQNECAECSQFLWFWTLQHVYTLVLICSTSMFRGGPWLWCCSVIRIMGIGLDVAYGIVTCVRLVVVNHYSIHTSWLGGNLQVLSLKGRSDPSLLQLPTLQHVYTFVYSRPWRMVLFC